MGKTLSIILTTFQVVYRPDSVSFPGGSQTYTYYALLRLEDISAPPPAWTMRIPIDNVSNILTKQMEHGNYAYDYDDLYRLTDVDNPTLDNETYTYDGVGNRATASNATGTITHNANNELLKYGDISYNYDANGNMVAQTSATETRQYVYNAQNRLVRVEDGSGGVIAEYFYDPFGRRLWKEMESTRTYFFYADEGLVAEYDENGNGLRSYGYTPDSSWTTDPLWLKQGGDYYWYQNDHLGTSQKLIDITGTVVWAAQYTAFGEAQIQVETVTNNLRFPGQYFDDETGLHYNWFRYYDPEIGRYIRIDPIGMAGGINVFTYASNTPMNASDPFGLVGIGAAIATCLATPGCREALIVGTYAGSVAICRALGVCQPLPLEDLIPPSLPAFPPPTVPGPYPEIHPIPPLFLPSVVPLPMAEVCEPEDTSYFPPEDTWTETVEVPESLPTDGGEEPDACKTACIICGAYLSRPTLRATPEGVLMCAYCAVCTVIPNFTVPGS